MHDVLIHHENDIVLCMGDGVNPAPGILPLELSDNLYFTLSSRQRSMRMKVENGGD